MRPSEEIQSDVCQIGLGTKETIMVWACDAETGGDPHNKKHIKYEGDGNKTERTSTGDMA